jgi:hypothetical protein
LLLREAAFLDFLSSASDGGDFLSSLSVGGGIISVSLQRRD